MPRTKLIDRPRKVEVQIPSSVWDKVQNELYSDVEGKIPFGATSRLATQLFIDWLKARKVAI
jgi:hypothetical protein